MCPDPAAAELFDSFPAMASTVTIRAHTPRLAGDLPEGARGAREVFADVERDCTRFSADSPLMQMNAHPERIHQVPDYLFRALVEAHAAYLRTDGRFDPRVLTDLVALGYDRSWPDRHSEPADPVQRPPRPPWTPVFFHAQRQVDPGGYPLDLGGIGKGLAVRWASEQLSRHTANYLVEAGGDCFCAGLAPEGGPWRVGVENPAGGSVPIAVLELRDRACATSSVRVRRWHAGSTEVHHLLDPLTGLPGGAGVAAVTVVGTDPADAEVASKTLFLSGLGRIAVAAEDSELAALWVDRAGGVGCNPAMREYLAWQAA